jgi:TonB family protein
MATTEIPPTRLKASANDAELHDVPVLVVQLQDDLARSRLREAFWMSVVFHLLVVIALATSPKWIPVSKPIAVHSAEELIRGKELTYLDLPHDRQKVEKPPDTDRISDKNRIATKRPTLDRRTLDELRDSARPGAPGRPTVPGPPPQPMAPPQAAQAAQAQPGQQAALGMRPAPPPPAAQTQAKLEPPPTMGKTGFGAAMSPGEQIQQAAKAAAAGRVGGGPVGGGGDYGLGTGSQGRIHSDMDILSDTMGVDFGPYLSRVLHDVRLNWYNLIPEVARAPLMKKGRVSIEFAILRDGKVAGMRLTSPSGDVSLDRAAWGGITGSNPFPPLPGEFRGSYLALRFHFYYNPDKNELQ